MKIKKFFVMALMVLVIGSLVTANSVSVSTATRYVYYNLDFLPQNLALYMLSFELSAGGFDFGPYMIPGTGYGELGCSIGRKFEITEKVAINLSTVPILWQYSEEWVDMAVIGKGDIYFNVPLNPSLGIYYAHLPRDTEKNGWFFSLSISQDFFPEKWYSFDLVGSVVYNKGLFLKDIEGFGGLIEISKSIKMSEKISLRGAFQYIPNEKKINENEKVFSLSLIYGF